MTKKAERLTFQEFVDQFKAWDEAIRKAEESEASTFQELAEALDTLESPAHGLEVKNARIVMEWITYPNGRVGLDGSGNISAVELEDPAEVSR